MNNEPKISLSYLNDFQKSLLARISYLDIDAEAYELLKREKEDIRISDLHMILKTPNHFYIGAVADIKMIKKITGIDMSDRELLQEIENAGLGNIKINDIRSNAKSGFEGMCLEDEVGNIGFSFRGTDLKTFKSLLNDVGTDVISYLTAGKVGQIQDAQDMFTDNSDKRTGKNYLYGHSLGGHLVESIYADNYDKIENAFVINPFNLDETIFENNPDRIEAFNNPKRFDCVIVGGDVVSKFNPTTFFEGNVRYVENTEQRKNNYLYAHTVEAGKIDERGMYVETPKQKAYEKYDIDRIDRFMGFADNVKKGSISNINIATKTLKIISLIREKIKSKFVARKKMENPQKFLQARIDKFKEISVEKNEEEEKNN